MISVNLAARGTRLEIRLRTSADDGRPLWTELGALRISTTTEEGRLLARGLFEAAMRLGATAHFAHDTTTTKALKACGITS